MMSDFFSVIISVCSICQSFFISPQFEQISPYNTQLGGVYRDSSKLSGSDCKTGKVGVFPHFHLTFCHLLPRNMISPGQTETNSSLFCFLLWTMNRWCWFLRDTEGSAAQGTCEHKRHTHRNRKRFSRLVPLSRWSVCSVSCVSAKPHLSTTFNAPGMFTVLALSLHLPFWSSQTPPPVCWCDE